mgnify:CR=1 FL=1
MFDCPLASFFLGSITRLSFVHKETSVCYTHGNMGRVRVRDVGLGGDRGRDHRDFGAISQYISTYVF